MPNKFTRMRDVVAPSEIENSLSNGGTTMDSQVGNHLQELRDKLNPKMLKEKGMDAINSVVGRPIERIISRDLLIPAPVEWDVFPKATFDKIKEMSESIRQYGLFHNITVWKQANGKYMILGGHTRVACFDYLATQESGEEDPDTPAGHQQTPLHKGEDQGYQSHAAHADPSEGDAGAQCHGKTVGAERQREDDYGKHFVHRVKV